MTFKNGANVELLLAMLQTKRPHDSKAESRFIREFMEPLPTLERDAFGNMSVLIEGKGDSILWSSHIDTVHFRGGTQKIRKEKDIVTLSPRSNANCLGADDTAGVWLMLEMIAAGKPGFYLFHRGEEYGGLGSEFIALHRPEILSGVSAAIALDRKGYDSVITHQGKRCASNAFANSLADGLGIVSLSPDSTGLFTDTANYIDHIGECSNLSVGYFNQHSARESLDLDFLIRMRSALLALDSDSLVYERKPGENDIAEFINRKPRKGAADESYCLNYDSAWHNGNFSEIFELEETARLLRDKPETCARALREIGITLDELCQRVYDIERDDLIPF